LNIPAIDKLCATIEIVNYRESAEELLNRLEAKKNEAKLVAANNASQKTLIDIGSQTFQVLPIGTMGYAYILRNEGYEVKMAQFRSKNENFYPLFIDISSEYLWSKGVEKSWNELLEWVNTNIGEVQHNKINRIDLCCHTDEIELVEDDCKKFLGQFHEDTIFRFRRKVNAMYFGSRRTQKLICRIYNKTLEVNMMKSKFWFFDIWAENVLNPDKVWNIEFEIRREFFKYMQMDTVEDVLIRLNTLWEYCTKQWLVKKELDKERMERCSTNETWASLQPLFANYKSRELIKREKQLQYDALALVPGTIGNITSFAARNGIDDIDEVFKLMKMQGNKHLFRKDKTYKEVINEKKSLLGQ
jgi:hypothetical protein